MIDAAHPVWREFPTDSHTDWQWWELLSRSFALDLEALPLRPAMPFRFVDKYNRNALPAAIFEARVGPGRLLVCTLDLAQDRDDRLAARQLRRSILTYMAGSAFDPRTELSGADLMSLFREPALMRYPVRASSAHDSHPPELAVDNDPRTFWHTDWMVGDQLPATFTVQLPEPALLRGFHYAPRADMNRGRIAQYSVEVSQDGQQWLTWVSTGQFPDNADRQTVVFPKPINAQWLRLVARTDHGAARHAAIAELEPLSEEITPDVRELGIVPGFNDRK
jgi:hypothetical protein